MNPIKYDYSANVICAQDSITNESPKPHPFISKVPADVWRLIFSYFNYINLSQTSLVCRRWCQLSKDPSLPGNQEKMEGQRFYKLLQGQMECVFSPNFRLPSVRLEHNTDGLFVFNLHNSLVIYSVSNPSHSKEFLGRWTHKKEVGDWLCFYSNECTPIDCDLLMLNKVNPLKIWQVDLTAPFKMQNDKEGFKVYRLEGCFPLSEDKFMTVLTQGEVAVWHISEIGVICENFFLLDLEIAKTGYLTACFKLNNYLFFQGSQSASNLLYCDLNQPNQIKTLQRKNWSGVQGNHHRLYTLSCRIIQNTRIYYLQAFCQDAKSILKRVWEARLGNIISPYLCTFSNKWLVVLATGLDQQHTHLYVFEANGGRRVLILLDNPKNYSFKLSHISLKGNFLAIKHASQYEPKDKIEIWHLPTRKKLRPINKDLCFLHARSKVTSINITATNCFIVIHQRVQNRIYDVFKFALPKADEHK